MATITGYSGSATTLSVPETLGDYAVLYIDNNAFANCTTITSVTFPTTLQSIGSSAFEGCTKLTGVTLPKNLSSLGCNAFANCTKLSSLTVNCTKLDSDPDWGVFQNAGIAGSGISVAFGSACTEVPAYLLYTDESSEAPYVTKITVPYTVTSIGGNAFGSLTGYTLAGYKGSVGWTYYKANKSDDDITWKKLGTVMSFCSVKLSTTSYVYNGKAKKPGVAVKDGSTTLKKGTHYTVTYAKGRKSIGTYKVTIKGVNSAGYYGSVTKTFKIVPGKVTLKKAKGGTNKFTVKWAKKAGGVKKYQVAYRSTGSSSWTYVTVSASVTGYTLKFGYWHSSSYQVKVRAVTGSCKGAWSKVKKVKVK